MRGMYSSLAIANLILDLARERELQLTNMQLQKLVFFAHAWYLALTGKPLIYDEVLAWPFGPVIRNLYNQLRHYGSGVVMEKIPVADTPPTEQYIIQVLRRIVELYGNHTAGQLSRITHQPGSPWSITWAKQKFSTIPNELIREHYHKLRRSESENAGAA